MNPYGLNRAKYGTHVLTANEIGLRKTVLDIGCSSGYLRKLVPSCEFYGIDYDKKSLQTALKNGYKRICNLDLNRYQKFNINKQFDVLLFADILEHLISPKDVLLYFINRHMKKGGKVIISLPNVAHISIRLQMLFGKFSYAQDGILDKTHLHFYTMETAKKFIKSCNLRIIKIKFSSNNFGIFIKDFPLLGTLFGYNIIFVCRKKS